MCGICGVFFKDPQKASLALSMTGKMLSEMEYRGPDSRGVFKHHHGAMAVNRLAIVDPQGSDQPISNDSGDLSFIYNGMVYNHEELRSSLSAKGHTFKTEGDGEVLLHSFEEYGSAFAEKISGMFASAFFDARTLRLSLLRDQFGIKTLYYALQDDGILFSSEFLPLARQIRDKNIDSSALNDYFFANYIYGGRTLFAQIRELRAGHCLFFDIRKNEICEERYFHLERAAVDQKISYGRAKEELRRLLKESVRHHLYADTSVGAFLSGGLDSSLISELACELKGEALPTYSLVSDNKAFDERHFSRLSSSAKQGLNQEISCTSEHVKAFLDSIGSHMDVPLGDQACVSSHLISQSASREVKVCLSGEGADELFFGYSTARADLVAGYLKFLPKGVCRGLAGLSSGWFSKGRNVDASYMISRFFKILGETDSLSGAHAAWRSVYSCDERGHLYLDKSYSCVRNSDYYAGIDVRDDFTCFSDGDMLTWLVYNNLKRSDVYGMRSSLEVRVPFLYRPLVDFVRRLPLKHRFRLFNTKALLRSAADGVVNKKIIKRSKKGWHIPVAQWMRSDLRAYFYELFKSDNLLYAYIDKDYILRMFDEHCKGRGNHVFRLWGTAVLMRYFKANRF